MVMLNDNAAAAAAAATTYHQLSKRKRKWLRLPGFAVWAGDLLGLRRAKIQVFG